jgi:hypothetical protein
MEEDFKKVLAWYILQSIRYNTENRELYLAGEAFRKPNPDFIHAEGKLYGLSTRQIEKIVNQLIPNMRIPEPLLENVTSYASSAPWNHISLLASNSIQYDLLSLEENEFIGIDLKGSNEFPVGRIMKIQESIRVGEPLNIQLDGSDFLLREILEIRILHKPEVFTWLDAMCTSGDALLRYVYSAAPNEENIFIYDSMTLDHRADSFYAIEHRISNVIYFPIEGKRFNMVEIAKSIRPFCEIDSTASLEHPFRMIRVNCPGQLEWKNDSWKILKKASINLI